MNTNQMEMFSKNFANIWRCAIENFVIIVILFVFPKGISEFYKHQPSFRTNNLKLNSLF